MSDTTPKRVLITGCSGQDGSYMADYLLANTSHQIYGMVRRTAKPDYSNLANALSHPDRFKLVTGDLSDTTSIDTLVKEIKPDYFINFAAQSFVGSSWQIPEQTFDATAVGVLRCLEAIRKHAPHCRFYSAGCHDSKTRVFTQNGLKNYADVEVGEMVWSINPNNRQMELKRVLRKIDKEYEGPMVHFTGHGRNTLVTPNHTVVYENPRNGGLLSKPAIDAREMSRFTFPRAKWTGRALPDRVDLTPHIPQKTFSKGVEITSIDSLDLFYLIGLFIGDGSCDIITKESYRIPREDYQRNRSASGQIQSAAVLEKMGIKKEKRTYKCPRITIDIPPEDKSFHRVRETLDRCGLSWSHHNSIDIYFSSWGLYHWFDKCGHVSWEKRIPKEYLAYEPALLKQILSGLLDSDGHRNRCITTTSFGLVQDIIELCSKLGYGVYFVERKPKSTTLKDGRVITQRHVSYDVYVRRRKDHYQPEIKTGWYDRSKKAEVVPYKGQIWCLEVEDNHNFMVEREGHVVFSGNSSEQWGDVAYSPQDEKHPMRPRSPYGAAKCAAAHLVKVYRESYGLYAVHGILTNHESERRGEEFVTRKITLGVARIADALRRGVPFEPIRLGNLDSKRDWSHALDFVDGIWRMLNQEEHRADLRQVNVLGVCDTDADGNYLPPHIIEAKREAEATNNRIVWSKQIREYVLASGETHTVRSFVEKAFRAAGFNGEWYNPTGIPQDEVYELCFLGHLLAENGKLERVKEVPGKVRHAGSHVSGLGWNLTVVSIDPAFYRPAEVDLLLGNPARAKAELGWFPKISFDELVRRMVENDMAVYTQQEKAA